MTLIPTPPRTIDATISPTAFAANMIPIRTRRRITPRPYTVACPRAHGSARYALSSPPGLPISLSRPIACVISLGMIQILFASPCASCGSIWRYW